MANDYIRRQAAIDAVKKNTFRLTFAEEQNCEGHVAWSAEAVYSDVMEGALLELPSAQPEPRWIPCSERLPEEPYGCLVTVWDTNPVTMDEFENILPYFVGWDGEQWNDGDGEQCPFEVVAWMPLPEPFHAERSKQ